MNSKNKVTDNEVIYQMMKLFNNQLKHCAVNAQVYSRVNTLCYDTDGEWLLDIYRTILKPHYNRVDRTDCILALLYTYYTLVLAEHTEDILYITDIVLFSVIPEYTEEIYFEITLGDEPFASRIRRKMFGME